MIMCELWCKVWQETLSVFNGCQRRNNSVVLYIRKKDLQLATILISLYSADSNKIKSIMFISIPYKKEDCLMVIKSNLIECNVFIYGCPDTTVFWSYYAWFVDAHWFLCKWQIVKSCFKNQTCFALFIYVLDTFIL